MEKQKSQITGMIYIKCKKCGIEKTVEDYYKSKLTKSGLRGVLCRRCNQAIGALGDTAESLMKAYVYLEVFENQLKENK